MCACWSNERRPPGRQHPGPRPSVSSLKSAPRVPTATPGRPPGRASNRQAGQRRPLPPEPRMRRRPARTRFKILLRRLRRRRDLGSQLGSPLRCWPSRRQSAPSCFPERSGIYAQCGRTCGPPALGPAEVSAVLTVGTRPRPQLCGAKCFSSSRYLPCCCYS